MLADGTHEHLIDNETWQKAQDRFIKNKMMYGKYAGEKKPSEFMLQGLVKCSSCGSTLTRSVSGSMQCQAYTHGKCDVSHSVLTAKLEEMVLSTIEINLKHRNISLVQKAAPKAENQNEVIEKQFIREKHKLIRIKEAYENGIDSLEEYQVNKRKITKQIEHLQDKKNIRRAEPKDELTKKSRAEQSNAIEQLRNPDISAEQKNILLRTFIEKIVFDRVKNQVQIFYYY